MKNCFLFIILIFLFSCKKTDKIVPLYTYQQALDSIRIIPGQPYILNGYALDTVFFNLDSTISEGTCGTRIHYHISYFCNYTYNSIDSKSKSLCVYLYLNTINHPFETVLYPAPYYFKYYLNDTIQFQRFNSNNLISESHFYSKDGNFKLYHYQ